MGKRLQEISSTRSSRERRVWRQAWFSSDTANTLRVDWNGNFQAYMDEFDFNFDDKGPKDAMQESMMLFRRLMAEADLTPKQSVTQKYWEPGRTAFAAALENLSAGTKSLHPDGDFVLVSLDFEGGCTSRVNEMGWATLDTRTLYALKQQATGRDLIKSHNLHVSVGRPKHHDWKYLFGTTGQVEPDALAQTIRDIFRIDDNLNPGKLRNIVLIAHGVSSEVSIFAKLGVDLSDLPSLKGIINTNYEAEKLCGKGACKLHHFLRSLDVPFYTGATHCAGNDAYYTLKALIAIGARRLQEQGASDAEWLQRVATDHQDVPTQRNLPYDYRRKGRSSQ